MKKKLMILLAALIVITTLCSVTAFAAGTSKVSYNDENGNQITVNGLYYNSVGYPMFNASCYYTDANGNLVYVGGVAVYTVTIRKVM